jgi:hypothetical protein
MLVSGMLRLRTATETVVLGFRAALGGDKKMCRLDSEDEIRRRLIDALSDSVQMDEFRRFWALWSSEPTRLNIVTSRQLIERAVASATMGTLAMYVVPDGSVKHVFAPAGGKAKASGSPASSSSIARGPAPPLTGSVVGKPINAGGDPRLGPDLLRLEDRLNEVMRRVLPKLVETPSADLPRLLEPGVVAECAEVLAAWASGYSHGTGLIVDALVTAAPLIRNPWAIMGAAENIAEALELTADAQTEWDLDQAVERLQGAISMIGAGAFITAIRRGVDRVFSVSAKSVGLRGAPPPVRPPPQRGPMARPARSSETTTPDQKLLPTLARSPIEKLANEAQNLPRKASTIEGARPGDVARIVTETGDDIIGRSKFADKNLDPRLQTSLGKIPEAQRSPTHGKCAEINAIDKALKEGKSVEGAKIQTAKVRAPGHPEHGSSHAPCATCSAVLKDLGVNHVP